MNRVPGVTAAPCLEARALLSWEPVPAHQHCWGRAASSRTRAGSWLCLSKQASACPVGFWCYTASLADDLLYVWLNGFTRNPLFQDERCIEKENKKSQCFSACLCIWGKLSSQTAMSSPPGETPSPTCLFLARGYSKAQRRCSRDRTPDLIFPWQEDAPSTGIQGME